jgi:polyphosphate kinase 2 (PPK2 family)
MSKTPRDHTSSGRASISKKIYKDSLRQLQVELVKLQRHFIECDDKTLIILEGRDAAGKNGTIKRIIQHLSPRDTRVVALGTPSNRDLLYQTSTRAPSSGKPITPISAGLRCSFHDGATGGSLSMRSGVPPRPVVPRR